MRKIYEKPAVIFENFVLSQNASGSCNLIAYFSEYACPAEDEEAFGMVFTDNILGCDYKDPGLYDSICYHVSADGSTLFSS